MGLVVQNVAGVAVDRPNGDTVGYIGEFLIEFIPCHSRRLSLRMNSQEGE